MHTIEILDGADVINTIVADAAFAQEHYPGAWRLAAQAPAAPPAAPAPRHITLGALQKRMGAMRVFALDTSAHPVCVALRSYLGRLTYIDLGDPDLRPMLQMLVATQQPAANAVFPGSGPLTEGDVEAIITAPVQEGERP